MDPLAEIADAAESLRREHGTAVEVEDRTIRLLAPVNGDPGFAVLRALGLAQGASPVGAAAHGGNGVAVGVWRSPDLYLARWTRGRRWVVGYRLTSGSRLNDYVRTEGRVPTRLETGNWYGEVPEEIGDAFVEAGILLDDPPFPVPKPTAPSPPARLRSASTAPPPPPSRTTPTPRSRPTPTAKSSPTSATRLCPSCQMRKAATQFIPSSELCVDCR